MTINSLSTSYDSGLWPSLSNSSSAQSSSTSSSSGSSTDVSSLSGPGELFKELDSLSSSDPTEFKKITAQIAQQLESAASSSTDSGEANFLSEMAANFSNASQTGNFSDLFPQQSAQSSQTADSSSAAPMPPPPPPGGFGNTSEGCSSNSSSSSNSSGSASSAASNTTDPIANIFGQALAQIQSYLSTPSTAIS